MPADASALPSEFRPGILQIQGRAARLARPRVSRPEFVLEAVPGHKGSVDEEHGIGDAYENGQHPDDNYGRRNVADKGSVGGDGYLRDHAGDHEYEKQYDQGPERFIEQLPPFAGVVVDQQAG